MNTPNDTLTLQNAPQSPKVRRPWMGAAMNALVRHSDETPFGVWQTF